MQVYLFYYIPELPALLKRLWANAILRMNPSHGQKKKTHPFGIYELIDNESWR